MQRVELARAVILAILAPLVGLGILIYLVVNSALAPWHLPLIVGLVFGPVVAWDKITTVGQRLERIGRALADEPEPEHESAP